MKLKDLFWAVAIGTCALFAYDRYRSGEVNVVPLSLAELERKCGMSGLSCVSLAGSPRRADREAATGCQLGFWTVGVRQRVALHPRGAHAQTV